MPPWPGGILTVGHSNRSVAGLCSLLAARNVQVVADVRSAPYSGFVPQFNKANLEQSLRGAGFSYLFLGEQLGGKPRQSCWHDAQGKVRYELLQTSSQFREGVSRLHAGLAMGFRIVLLCAEENPFSCHRHHLIARHLELHEGIPVHHLRADGTLDRALRHLHQEHSQLSLF
ncbi:DUF488 domain-containing protein [Thiovibrio sp. JS02]